MRLRLSQASGEMPLSIKTSDQWMNAVGDASIERLEKVVLWVMLRYMNRQTCLMWASKATLALDSGYTERWIRKGIRSLEFRGVIAVVQPSKGGFVSGRGLTSAYIIEFDKLEALSRKSPGINSGTSSVSREPEVSARDEEASSTTVEASSYKQAPSEQEIRTKWVREILLKHVGPRKAESITEMYPTDDLVVALKGIYEQKAAGEIRSVGGIIRSRLLNIDRQTSPTRPVSADIRDVERRITQARYNNGIAIS